uniref:C2H2-type domain-containing protein n=1 Tax=Timema tahoe TaxID=61484 RepID=A0A7R9IJE6_9NEOP|nr:unnamed protein product [Timema tahoe]
MHYQLSRDLNRDLATTGRRTARITGLGTTPKQRGEASCHEQVRTINLLSRTGQDSQPLVTYRSGQSAACHEQARTVNLLSRTGQDNQPLVTYRSEQSTSCHVQVRTVNLLSRTGQDSQPLVTYRSEQSFSCHIQVRTVNLLSRTGHDSQPLVTYRSEQSFSCHVQVRTVSVLPLTGQDSQHLVTYSSRQSASCHVQVRTVNLLSHTGQDSQPLVTYRSGQSAACHEQVRTVNLLSRTGQDNQPLVTYRSEQSTSCHIQVRTVSLSSRTGQDSQRLATYRSGQSASRHIQVRTVSVLPLTGQDSRHEGVMSYRGGYRRERSSYQGSNYSNSSNYGGGSYGDSRGSSNVNPWEGGMVPGRSSGGSFSAGIAGLLPTPSQPNLLSQLSSPEAQLAIASNLLTSLLRPQQSQVPSLLNLSDMTQSNNGGPGGYRHQNQYGENRYQDRRKPMRDGRRIEPYTKPGQNRRGGPIRPGSDRRPQGRTTSLGKGGGCPISKDGKLSKKDDDKAKTDSDQDKDGKNEEDGKREEGDDEDKKRDWKEEKKSEDEGDKSKGKNDSGRYTGVPEVLFFCHVCRKHMWDGQSFDNHLKGRTHQLMMDKLEESYKIKVELMRHEQAVAEQQREIELDRMKRQGKRFHMGTQEYCTMCDLTFYGSLVTHRKHERHQQLKAFLHPRCLPCGKEFPTRIEWDHHRLTPLHLKKTAEARKKQKAAAGGDDEDEFTLDDFISAESGSYGDELNKDMKMRTREQEEDDIQEKQSKDLGEGEDGEKDKRKEGEEEKSKDDIKEGEAETGGDTPGHGPGQSLRHRIPKYNTDVPVGKSLLKKVDGVACRLCHRFFQNDEDALISLPHFGPLQQLYCPPQNSAKDRREALKRKEEEVAAGTEKRPANDDNSVDDEGNWKRRRVTTAKNDEEEDTSLTTEKDKASDVEMKTSDKSKEGVLKDESVTNEKYDPFEGDADKSLNNDSKVDKTPEKKSGAGMDVDEIPWEEVDKEVGNLIDSIEGESDPQEGDNESTEGEGTPKQGTRAAAARGRGASRGSNTATRSRAGRRRK